MKRFVFIGICLLLAFVVQAAKLTIVAPNNGEIYALDAKGNKYTPSATPYDLAQGTELIFYAQPISDCYWFSQWNCVGATMQGDTLRLGNADVTVRGLFIVYQYTVSADVEPLETGSVTMEIGLGDIFIHLSGKVNCGMQVRMTATATSGTGYHFARWSDGNTESVRMVEVSGDANYTAIFENGKEMQQLDELTLNEDDITAQKRILDGHVVIERNNVVYTIEGIIINK